MAQYLYINIYIFMALSCFLLLFALLPLLPIPEKQEIMMNWTQLIEEACH
jgi:hypothetical protein